MEKDLEKENLEEKEDILRIVAVAGIGYDDDKETLLVYKVLDKKELFKNLNDIKKKLKEWYEEQKRIAKNLGVLQKFPLDVYKLELLLNDKKIGEVYLEMI